MEFLVLVVCIPAEELMRPSTYPHNVYLSLEVSWIGMAWHGMGMALHWRGVGFTQVYSVFVFCSLVSTSQVCAHQLVLVEVQCNAGVNFFL